MAYAKEIWHRLRHLARLSPFHSELNEEMQFHIECRAEELQVSGLSPDLALARARREFGSTAKAAEDTRDAWRFSWLEDLASDILYAARALKRNPGFALTAVFCLMLGIGANTTIFSVTTSFLFSLPSCRDASSIIAIWEGGNSASSLADYKFLRDAKVFTGTAGINPESQVNWRDGDHTSRLFAGAVTDDYFSVLDVPFLLGRGIAPGETDTVVLSHRLWRNRWAEDPTAVGRRMVLDGKPYTIAGVLPADHRNIVGFGYSPDIYVPVVREKDIVQFYARLPEGMTIELARQRLRSVFEELDRIHPKDGWKRAKEVRITGITGLDILAQEQMGVVVGFFGLLLTVVGLVLLIACTNVASLLLARASSRSRELGIRLSLGASRLRIVRHLLAESLLLASLGGVAGLALTAICTRLIASVTLPLPVPIQIVTTPDWRLLLYFIGIAMASAMASGLVPAITAVRKDVNAALKSDQHQGGRAWGLSSVLVSGQLAVSIVLLATGFLFLHNLQRVTTMNPGFDTEHTVWAYMRLVPENYTDQAKKRLLVEEALQRLRSLPGVSSAGITRRVPLNDNCIIGTEVRSDVSAAPMHVNYECNDVGPDYFRAIGIPLLLGREFSVHDRQGSQKVAIVNETFAKAVFGDMDPVGHTVTVDQSTMQIIGLVKDSKYFTLGEKQKLALYESYLARDQSENLQFIVRTAGMPSASVKPVQDVLAALDSTAAIEIKPMLRALGLALLPSQVGAAMLGALGVLSLALASIGLYGGLLYTVSRRTREIGIRVALGSTPAQVLRVVCRHTAALVGAGMSIGLALAFLATRPLEAFLVPGLPTYDPAAFLAVAGVFLVVALLATLVPAWKALSVDPANTLRYD